DFFRKSDKTKGTASESSRAKPASSRSLRPFPPLHTLLSCSFDNGQLSQIATPKITTVDIDLKRYGKRAVELLRWRWDNPNEPFQEVLLSTKLIKRESTATKPTR
ncbi:substrate-binding domain-containing protein, partial [Geobacillus thermoleovorans]